MANEIVKYHNDMNTVALRNFNKYELDIFMAILSRIRDKEEDIIEYDFNYLKKLIGWYNVKGRNTKNFALMLDSVYHKLIKCDIKIGNSVKWTRFVLFTEYTIDTEKQTIKIGVNTKFKYIINNLLKHFTRYELDLYCSFKSTYTQEFFRKIKQFNKYSEQSWTVSLEEFRRYLDIPSSYKVSDIDKHVLTPIKKELAKKYNLRIKKNYQKNNIGKGRPKLIGYVFTFNNFTSNELDISTYESVKISKNYQIGKYNFKRFFENEFWLYFEEKGAQKFGKLRCIYDIHYNKFTKEICLWLGERVGDMSEKVILEDEKHLWNYLTKFDIKKTN